MYTYMHAYTSPFSRQKLCAMLTEIAEGLEPPQPRSQEAPLTNIRGNHLSCTTCLTQVFFKSGE